MDHTSYSITEELIKHLRITSSSEDHACYHPQMDGQHAVMVQGADLAEPEKSHQASSEKVEMINRSSHLRALYG